MNEMPTITSSAYVSTSTSGSQLFMDSGANLKAAPFLNQILMQQQQAVQPQEQKMAARIVKVFIADPNENIPLEKRVLYSGDEKLTDLTDQELFFEVPIADLLGKHNDYRKTVVDKKQAEKFGRDIFLEPARIRDLKMVVVAVAQF
jgi:hypothetical protein